MPLYFYFILHSISPPDGWIKVTNFNRARSEKRVRNLSFPYGSFQEWSVLSDTKVSTTTPTKLGVEHEGRVSRHKLNKIKINVKSRGNFCRFNRERMLKEPRFCVTLSWKGMMGGRAAGCRSPSRHQLRTFWPPRCYWDPAERGRCEKFLLVESGDVRAGPQNAAGRDRAVFKSVSHSAKVYQVHKDRKRWGIRTPLRALPSSCKCSLSPE